MKIIWAKEIREQKNHTLGFVYKLRVKGNEKLKIAASSLYRLFVDGFFTGYGPARAAHGYSRVDEYDLSSYAGKTIHIVIEVFASNVNTFYIVDELPFFAAEIVMNNQVVADSADFKAFLLNDRVTKIQRFSFQRSFAESYRIKKCRQNFYKGDVSFFDTVETESVEGNKFLERIVHYPTLEFLPYQSQIEEGKVFVQSNNNKWLDRCVTEINERFKGFPYDELDECISDEYSNFSFKQENLNTVSTLSSKQYRSYDFKRTLTGFLSLKITAKKPTVFYIAFDEIVTKKDGYKEINPFRNTCCNIIKYCLDAGDYELLSFEANSMRFAQIVVLEGETQLKEFGVVLYENPDAKKFKYDTKDKELNAIIDAAVNTFAQNAVDVLTDCPSRERAGWLCDSYFSSRAEELFTGENLVEKSFLENYIMSPQSEFLPKGMLPMCYPADFNDGCYIPNWAMWFVLELKLYLKRTGDKELTQKAKPRIYDLIACFSKYINEDGLLENLEGWVFIEWSKCNDSEYIKGVNYPSNMLYSKMLRTAGELYDDEALKRQSESMKKAIIDQSFNGEFFEDNRIREDGILKQTGHLTETCQYYAFYFDIASKEQFPELFERMIIKFGPMRNAEKTYPNVYPSNAIVGNYLRLELLLREGRYTQVLEECKAFFTEMAELTGTLWEHSNLNASLNHGFASVAANYIIESVKDNK